MFEGGAAHMSRGAGGGASGGSGASGMSAPPSNRMTHRRVSLRTAAAVALRTHVVKPENRLLQRKEFRSKELSVKTAANKSSDLELNMVHPWTVLQEHYVHCKLGEEDQGVRIFCFFFVVAFFVFDSLFLILFFFPFLLFFSCSCSSSFDRF